jgi:hypothetical protein
LQGGLVNINLDSLGFFDLLYVLLWLGGVIDTGHRVFHIRLFPFLQVSLWFEPHYLSICADFIDNKVTKTVFDRAV